MEDDIYRGQVLLPPEPTAESAVAPSITSSSGSFITGRLGALAAIVEHAITRWARSRRRSSSVSASSQSSTSTSSIYTPPFPRPTRWRRRRTSSANARSLISEREVAARLGVRKKVQQADRGFTLYIAPSSLDPEVTATQPLETFGIPEQPLHIVLDRLEAALKKVSRAKKVKEKHRQQSLGLPPTSSRSDFTPDTITHRPASFADLSALRSSVQGKQTYSQGTRTYNESAPRGSHELNQASKAWWLDVASPTWEDLQTIGKLLHIHPLTLEDILQQDPREKMETFAKLGYYFISFRAIQSATVTKPVQHQQNSNDTNIDHTDDDALREANIYMVVFKEGICTFYFADVSEHIKKVKNRLQLLQDNSNMSSDWIAHGILDSVVDSFFPILKEIGQQVLFVESLVFPRDDTSSSTNILVDTKHIPTGDLCDSKLEKDLDTQLSSKESRESAQSRDPPHPRPHPRITEPQFSQRLKLYFQNLLKTSVTSHSNRIKPIPTTTTDTLLRMARARRLVTSLVRLLATKSEVISQIHKRLRTDGRRTSSFKGHEDVEIAIYMEDIQDHILNLQQSLHHYEGILSQSHPAYLIQLRVDLFKTRDRNDKAMMIISTIAMGDMCLQVLAGCFSLNVKLPKNSIHPPGPYNYFAMVMLLCIVVEAIFLVTARRWWIQAKRARSTLS